MSKLTIESCKVKILESDMQKISHDLCGNWRALPAHFDMKSIVVSDIEKTTADEPERRHKFLLRWEQEKGSEATHAKLISSLLEINCRSDAEEVYKMVQHLNDRPPQDSSTSTARKTGTV